MERLGEGVAAQTAGLRRVAVQLGQAIVGSPGSRWAPPTVTAAVAALAATPYAGWRTPALWFAIMVVLIAGGNVWSAETAKTDWAERPNPFLWLMHLGFSAAAFYLTFFFSGPAQTLGVTLYGVGMFQILMRDHATPRRLLIHLLPMIASVCLIQAAAAVMIIAHGHAWRLLTLFASTFIAFRSFRSIQANLKRSGRAETEARALIAESEARYRLLAEHSPDVILGFDLAGRIEYASPAVQLYGVPPEAVVGRYRQDFLDPAERPSNEAFLQALARGERLPQGEEVIWGGPSPASPPIVFEASHSAITDEKGRVIGGVAILRDVTARRALEDELRQKTADAEAATMAKSQFLANMSHEIRTPLTGVIGFAGLLRSFPDLPDDARRYAERIKTSADALLSVVNDVLDFSKLEAGHVEIDRQPVDPAAFIAETVDLIAGRAAEKGLTVRVEDHAPLPNGLMIDAPHLRQVLLNLLTNAVKFTEAGEIRVRPAYDEGQRQLSVEVADSGIGIAPEVAGQLFQRFSQVDSSSTRQHGGSGLGLAISKALVELMGGGIEVSSAPGVGSTFRFRLPAPPVEGEWELLVEDEPTVEIRSVRLLVVDDVPVNRELVRAILEPFDVEVREAASGAEAIEASLAQAFDLILMDLQMPVMDGMAAAAQIRARPGPNRLTPILALSANVLPEHIEITRKAGMNDHIGKPIDPAELLGKIAYWTSAGATVQDEFVGAG